MDKDTYSSWNNASKVSASVLKKLDKFWDYVLFNHENHRQILNTVSEMRRVICDEAGGEPPSHMLEYWLRCYEQYIYDRTDAQNVALQKLADRWGDQTRVEAEFWFLMDSPASELDAIKTAGEMEKWLVGSRGSVILPESVRLGGTGNSGSRGTISFISWILFSFTFFICHFCLYIQLLSAGHAQIDVQKADSMGLRWECGYVPDSLDVPTKLHR